MYRGCQNSDHRGAPGRPGEPVGIVSKRFLMPRKPVLLYPCARRTKYSGNCLVAIWVLWVPILQHGLELGVPKLQRRSGWRGVRPSACARETRGTGWDHPKAISDVTKPCAAVPITLCPTERNIRDIISRCNLGTLGVNFATVHTLWRFTLQFGHCGCQKFPNQDLKNFISDSKWLLLVKESW